MKLEKVKTDPCFKNRYEDFVLIKIVHAEISKREMPHMLMVL